MGSRNCLKLSMAETEWGKQILEEKKTYKQREIVTGEQFLGGRSKMPTPIRNIIPVVIIASHFNQGRVSN